MKLLLSRVAEFLVGSGEVDHNALAMGYSIDSRTIQAGELFFAVKGERMDGHDFVAQVLEKGAVGAVVRKDQLARYPVIADLLAVDDTLAPGVVAMPMGWGSTAPGNPHSSLTSQLISLDRDVETINFMPRQTAIPVEVTGLAN